MPLLRELGQEVASQLPDIALPPELRLDISNFELWLSYLSADAPWLDEASRLRNQAAFVSVSRVIADVVAKREMAARAEPMPEWLALLVARWHEDRAIVISFNYDDLVEAAYTAVVQVQSGDQSENYVSHKQLEHVALSPILSRGGAALWHSPVSTFALLKLHGSRSWVYSGRSSYYGETIYDTCRVRGWAPEGHDPRAWLSADKVPLIVPPTSGKTGFFDNKTVRSRGGRLISVSTMPAGSTSSGTPFRTAIYWSGFWFSKVSERMLA